MILKLLFLPTILTLLFAKDMDPNGFFKDRNWKVSVNKQLKIVAKSKYLGEPIQRPNKVIANLQCSKKKSVEVLNKKYCGINYMKVVGGKLEIFFLDYDSSDSRGYCRKKRIERFDIPSCNKKK